MAPEVLKGSYTSQAGEPSVANVSAQILNLLTRRFRSVLDLWSVGVIAFMLLSSQMPFYGRKRYVSFELETLHVLLD
jgi:serine/threonine protein kinase